MPVTVRPSGRTPERVRLTEYVHARSPEQLLASITTDDDSFGRRDRPRPRKIIQSSFASLTRTPSTTFAAKNGLVHACLEAYNNHHNLVLRPDDVWLAILTQLSAHINASAESLRPLFVGHPRQQRPLHIDADLSSGAVDHGVLAQRMARLAADNLQDPSLGEWIVPGFSTTTATDAAVASVVFLGTMQRYFTYSWGTRCGLPAVTLLGEAADWAELAARCAERLGTGRLGPDAARWHRSVLAPVLDGFVETFRDPAGPAARRFWRAIVDRHVPDGSGSVSYSGWITAFCYWDERGRCLHDPGGGGEGVRLTRSQIPMGFAKVPVTLLDYGVEIATEMVAGSVGIRAREFGEDGEGSTGNCQPGGLDTVQPESGWFMYLP